MVMVIVITMSMTVTVGLEMEGGRSSVVSSASELKSEDPGGLDPVSGQGEGQFLCPSESALAPA